MTPGSASTPRAGRFRRLAEVAGAFLKLGCISFGGPVAHLSYLHDEFVTRRRWLEEAAYADLVAMCQFLPGPASSQLVFALGMHRAGLAGALLASACFTLPSAVLMILFAYGVAALGGLAHAGWLHGLKLAAVAVVAQAVWTMGRKLCPDRARLAVALLSAALMLVLPGAAVQVALIALGALAGWALYRREVVSVPAPGGLARHHGWAAGALVVFAALLVVLPVIATATGSRPLAVFDSFYRAGSLVFGGGHVILPLLRAEVVPPGWVSDNAFLAGYGAAQAVPGPLFTFAAYLGTVMHGGPGAWLGGLWCLLALFLPAWLLIGGALPFWQLLRGRAWAQAALRGANAAVVGVLLAALYNPVWTSGVTGARDVAALLLAFALLEVRRAPSWLVVALMAAAGQWLL
ncbi:MAG: chromate efflux transporter [Verrucomicrobia bacterium]|nr:chromate efflux transporter [Pseudomonadota bacterium]MBS0632632.1 chromate efflux transporter [Verrucomicrobiota bacterium]